jgi:TonB family protein
MRRKNFWYRLVWSLHEDEAGGQSDKDGTVSFQILNRMFAVSLLLIGGWIAISTPFAWGQAEVNRKVKIKVPPEYPELARRMNITGVVRIEVAVATNGSIKNAKVVGGHPVLAAAALVAIKKWRFEAGPQESTGIVEFRFDPTQ